MMMFIRDHWYKFNDRGEIHIGYYVGRQSGFECCVCGKGGNAYTFNVWSSNTDYETWGYGKEHLPAMIEDLGISNGVIIDRQWVDFLLNVGIDGIDVELRRADNRSLAGTLIKSNRRAVYYI